MIIIRMLYTSVLSLDLTFGMLISMQVHPHLPMLKRLNKLSGQTLGMKPFMIGEIGFIMPEYLNKILQVIIKFNDPKHCLDPLLVLEANSASISRMSQRLTAGQGVATNYLNCPVTCHARLCPRRRM